MTYRNQPPTNYSFNDAPIANSITWFSDTGANQHVTLDIASMTSAKPYLGNDQLHIDDGMGLVISNITHTTLHTPKHTFTLSNILHVPQIKQRNAIFCSIILS